MKYETNLHSLELKIAQGVKKTVAIKSVYLRGVLFHFIQAHSSNFTFHFFLQMIIGCIRLRYFGPNMFL